MVSCAPLLWYCMLRHLASFAAIVQQCMNSGVASSRCHFSPSISSCTSPDDVFLLTSAVDNEVKQYLALDGRLHMDLEIPKTGMDENFTRSYYTSSGRWGYGCAR